MLKFFQNLIRHPSAPEVYHYKSGRNFANAGAGAFVFQSDISLPVVTRTGPGKQQTGCLRITAGTPLVQHRYQVAAAGMPLQSGSIVLAGLSQADAIDAAYKNLTQR